MEEEGAIVEGGLHPYGHRVYVLGEQVLREKCAVIPVDAIVQGDQQLLAEVNIAHSVLRSFRSKMGFGRALAASQVGIKKRFVVMNLGDSAPRTLFNPVITERSEGTFTMWDDCLSFPDKMACVRRNTWVSVRWTNEQGEEEEWRRCAQDLSELLQHELDHLDGVLAVDHAVPPPQAPASDSIIARDEYLRCRAHYDSLVDFHY